MIEAKYYTINVIPPNLTPNIILKRTQEHMNNRFVTYSAYNNNCQDFIDNLLLANNINNEDAIKFVKQDTENIFKHKPNLRKFSNTQ